MRAGNTYAFVELHLLKEAYAALEDQDVLEAKLTFAVPIVHISHPAGG